MGSRYSPTVTPDFGGEGFADLLSRAFERKRERRRQDVADADTKRSRDLQYYEAGGRTGTPPADPGATVTVDRPVDFPTSLTDRRPTPAAPSALDAPDASFDAAFQQELIHGGPSAGTGRARAPMAEHPSESHATPAPLHPGAFDPASRTFGGSAAQMAVTAASVGGGGGRQVNLGPTGRYTPIDDSHYIDETATPAAERQRDRISQMELAAAFRDHDIRTRNEGALSLEDERNRNRMALRDRINAGRVTEILTRGDVQGKNQAAHDARTAGVSAAHDARVTQRQKDVASRPATEGQREANAIRAAEGVLQATSGDYNAAVDWLENTLEGKDAAQHGLARRHLYAALGKFVQGTSAAALRLEAGISGATPEEATANVDKTRTIVTGKNKRSSAAAPGPVGGAAAAGAKRTITQEQYDRAIAAGHADSAIASAYDIPATVKRKK